MSVMIGSKVGGVPQMVKLLPDLKATPLAEAIVLATKGYINPD